MNRAMRAVSAAAFAFSAIVFVMPNSEASAPAESLAVATDLATCVDTRGRILVELLIDESGSLKDTDRGNKRVDAVKVALAGLANLAAEDRTIEVRLSGFGVDYRPLTEWTVLSSDSLASLQSRAEDYAGRNKGFDTDYANALIGVQQSIAQRSGDLRADGSRRPCSSVWWFTDGRYDIEDRNTASERSKYATTKPYAPGVDLGARGGGDAAVLMGMAEICRRGGVADQLRDARTSVLAFVLSDAGAPVALADQGRIESIVGGRDCGRKRSWPTGATYVVEDISGILFQFDLVSSTSDGGQSPDGQVTTPVCDREACPTGTRTFAIDAGLNRFHLLVEIPSTDVVVAIESPAGGPAATFVSATARDLRLGEAQIAGRWPAPNALMIDATRGASDGGWVGTWKVTFVDPTGQTTDLAKSQLHVFGDLEPRLLDPETLIIGEAVEVEVDVVHQDGTPITSLDDFQSAEMTLAVKRPGDEFEIQTAQALTRDGDRFAGEVRLPIGDPGQRIESQVNLTIGLVLVTKSGIALKAIPKTIAVPVRPPVSYPRIEPAELSFPSITGEKTATTEFTVIGGKDPGCVWFEAAEIGSLPAGVTTASVAVSPNATSRGSCLKVDAGERKVVRLSVSPDGIGDGELLASITANFRTDVNDRVIAQAFAIEVGLQKPIDRAKQIEVLLGLLIPGILLPFVVVWLLKLATAKFEGVDTMRVACIAVSVEGRKVNRAGHSDPEIVSVADLQMADNEGSPRAPRIGDLALKSRVGLNPFTAPFGVVVAPAGTVLHSGYGHDGERLPLTIGDTWIFVGSELGEGVEGPRADGVLYVLIAGVADARDRVVEIDREVRRALPGFVATAAERVKDRVVVLDEAIAEVPRVTTGQPEDDLVPIRRRSGETIDEPPPVGSSRSSASPHSPSHDDTPPPSRYSR